MNGTVSPLYDELTKDTDLLVRGIHGYSGAFHLCIAELGTVNLGATVRLIVLSDYLFPSVVTARVLRHDVLRDVVVLSSKNRRNLFTLPFDYPCLTHRSLVCQPMVSI